MSRDCTSTGQDAWIQASAALLLAFVCYLLPVSAFAASSAPAQSTTVLRIQGSNTIGASLAPALARGLFAEQGLHSIRTEPGLLANEQHVIGRNTKGQELRITIAAHGTGTGFSALGAAQADLAAASRPVKNTERQQLSAFGDLRSAAAEHIIGLDGLAIIVHPRNPLTQLSTAELARVFAGEITHWSSLGIEGGRIRLYARDDNSGTFDTFNELVLGAHQQTLAANARRFESSQALSDAVSQDVNAIGFIGLPYIRQAKALAVASGEALAMQPNPSQVATEDYPLSRRLFLYQLPQQNNPWAKAFLDFSQSQRGQTIVADEGFIPQTITPLASELATDMPPAYQKLAANAQRLSVNFRFQPGSAVLDNKAIRDLSRLQAYLQTHNKLKGRVVLVGFADSSRDAARAELLSKLRALAVRRELQRHGVQVREFIGLGDGLPVASEQAADGRLKNRRVEVWVY